MRMLWALAGTALLAASPAPEPIHGLRHPAISPDGRRLAFSWRGDLWVCPSAGGVAERITDDPADEQKPAWSPDGKQVAFTSDKTGNRDLFVLDLATKAVRALTFHSAADDAPAWSPDGRWIAFQSNRDSNLDLCLNNDVWDVWRVPAGGGTATRVTRFRGENPAWSPDGKWIAYDRYASGYADGEHNLFLVASDGSGVPRELAAGSEDSRRPVFKGSTIYFAHEANGIRFAGHRNVWKTTTQGGGLVQVTGHGVDHVTWPTASEGSDLLVYEYDFDLYSIDLRDRSPKPRKLEIAAELPADDRAAPKTFSAGFSSPSWAPGGSRIVFACRGDLWTSTPEGGEAEALTKGEADDREPSWSADGKSVVYVSGAWGEPGHLMLDQRCVTREAGHWRTPRLSPDGSRILATRTEGGETDVWIVDAGSGVARTLVAERNVEESWGTWSPDGASVALLASQGGRTEVAVLPTDGGRSKVLKSDGAAKAGLTWSPDGTRLAYAARNGDGRWSVRVLDVAKETEREAAAGAESPAWSPDSSMLLCEVEPRGMGGRGTDGRALQIFDARSAQKMPVAVKVTQRITRREEMRSVFLQVWGSYYHHYYDPFFHGLDMAALRRKYEELAAACRTKPELYDLVNDMIREFRSSHIHLRPAPVRNGAATGSLAADLERNEDGTLAVRRIEADGPADKAGLRDGETIMAVGETDLGPAVDFDRLMTGAEGIPEVRLAVRDAAGDVRTAILKGLDRTALRVLKYENVTRRRKERVRELSGGRLAYFHIRMMTTAEVTRLREAIEKEFGDAEGLVFDERDGVGGMAHRPVCALLDSTSAERLNKAPACWMRNRNGWTGPDKFGGGESRKPAKSWDRPVVMIMNEISRSDKEILPYTFRHLGIGYLVGMPTAGGVIGGSDWTMQDGSRIVVSVQGWFTAEGRNLEGWGVPPDHRVPETHEDLYAGCDAQLEKAVEVLLAQKDGKLASPKKPGAERKAEGSGSK